MGRPGLPELLLILLVVLLLFGSKRLPDLSRSVGRSLRILKSETKAMRDEDADDDDRGSAAVDEPRREITGGGAAPRPTAAPTSEQPSDVRAREGSESR